MPPLKLGSRWPFKGFFRTRRNFSFEALGYKELWEMPYGMVGAVTSRGNALLLKLSPLLLILS